VGDITGVINPVMAGYVARVIDQAENSEAAAVVFTVDTPGGLSDSTREITQRMLAARVPVIMYVAPEGARAGSAGVFITYSTHWPTGMDGIRVSQNELSARGQMLMPAQHCARESSTSSPRISLIC
jgi:hypothetical protein